MAFTRVFTRVFTRALTQSGNPGPGFRSVFTGMWNSFGINYGQFNLPTNPDTISHIFTALD